MLGKLGAKPIFRHGRCVKIPQAVKELGEVSVGGVGHGNRKLQEEERAERESPRAPQRRHCELALVPARRARARSNAAATRLRRAARASSSLDGRAVRWRLATRSPRASRALRAMKRARAISASARVPPRDAGSLAMQSTGQG